MVLRYTTLVLSLGLRIGPACEAGLSAGMQRELMSPRIKKNERKKVRGPATEITRSPVLVHVCGISNVRLPAGRRCEQLGIADVSVTKLLM